MNAQIDYLHDIDHEILEKLKANPRNVLEETYEDFVIRSEADYFLAIGEMVTGKNKKTQPEIMRNLMKGAALGLSTFETSDVPARTVESMLMRLRIRLVPINLIQGTDEDRQRFVEIKAGHGLQTHKELTPHYDEVKKLYLPDIRSATLCVNGLGFAINVLDDCYVEATRDDMRRQLEDADSIDWDELLQDSA